MKEIADFVQEEYKKFQLAKDEWLYTCLKKVGWKNEKIKDYVKSHRILLKKHPDKIEFTMKGEKIDTFYYKNYDSKINK